MLLGPQFSAKLTDACRSHEEYITPANSHFTLKLVTSFEVVQHLSNLPNNKATVLDKKPCHLVKEGAPINAKSICAIFNCSVITVGISSSNWN